MRALWNPTVFFDIEKSGQPVLAKFELRKTDEEALKARLKLVGKEGETFKQGIRAKLALLSNKTSVAAWLNNVSLSGANASSLTYFLKKKGYDLF